MSNFGIFYDARSSNMAMSRDPRSKFLKNLFFPNSAFNIRKSYKISSRKALYFRSYQPKTSQGRGCKTSPHAFRVKLQRFKKMVFSSNSSYDNESKPLQNSTLLRTRETLTCCDSNLFTVSALYACLYSGLWPLFVL